MGPSLKEEEKIWGPGSFHRASSQVNILSREAPCPLASCSPVGTHQEHPATSCLGPRCIAQGQCKYSPVLPIELTPKVSFCENNFRERGSHPMWENSHDLHSPSTAVLPHQSLRGAECVCVFCAGRGPEPAAPRAERPAHANPANTLI